MGPLTMTSTYLFKDRRAAGSQLAAALSQFSGRRDVVVVGLPRGGVVVAAEVADILGVPLSVLVVRKLGLPWHPELAFGAIAPDTPALLDQGTIVASGITGEQIEAVVRQERAILDERRQRYGCHGALPDCRDKVVLVVDDGLATGNTMRAALRLLRARGVARLIAAVPVAAASSLEEVRTEADDVLCLYTPSSFRAVGEWYSDFAQVGDQEVMRAFTDLPTSAVQTPDGPIVYDLVVPHQVQSIIFFAHGSGSNRRSPRNRQVAAYLRGHNLATCMIDLLTPWEQEDDKLTHNYRLDIPRLAKRLNEVTQTVTRHGPAWGLPIGYFGASSGAAVALFAAADQPSIARAVVSRGGRPDLAAGRLSEVTAATLLLVGANDPDVLELNRKALRQLQCVHELQIIPGAGHLFEEPGSLDIVARRTALWFQRYLV